MNVAQEMDIKKEFAVNDSLDNWYRSSERSKHPHPKKIKVECSLDEDVIHWLEEKASADEEYHIYINHFLRKMMEK